MGVRDHHVHQPVGRHRVLPGERLVDARRAGPPSSSSRSSGPCTKPRCGPSSGVSGLGAGMRLRVGVGGLGIGRLEAQAAGRLDRAEQDLQQVQRAAVWKPLEWAEMPRIAWIATGRPTIRSCRSPRKSVQGRSITTGSSKAARAISAASWRIRSAGMPVRAGHLLGRVVGREVVLGHVVHHRAVGDALAAQRGRRGRAPPLAVPGRGLAGAAVDDQRPALLVAQQQTVLRRLRVAVHEAGRVGEAREVVEVDPPRLQQALDQRQDQQPVGARRDAVPVVGHGVVAGADRVDPDHLGAAGLELADARS